MKLVMTIGIPGSGKSYWAKEEVRRVGAIRVNKDDIRAANKGMKEWKVIETEDGLIQDAMDRKKPYIICDNTHLNKRHWERLRRIAFKNDYEFVIKWFDDSLDADLCHKRNLGSDRTAVPWTVIEDMYQGYFKLWMEREGFDPKEYMEHGQPVVIIDIDGTVAHNDDLRGFFEWDKVGLDLPHKDIIDLVKMMMSFGLKPVFMSGRDEVCRELTEKWIETYMGIVDAELYMRKKDDMRNDAIVKLELFKEHIIPRAYNVKYVLDDRHRVVRMWRALGLRCLAVANGFF